MPKLALLGMALFAMLLFSANASGIYNNSNLTSAINGTQQLIESVNQSAYIVFYPNLTAAYNYLQQARNQTNAANVYLLLSKAKASALQQQARINQYRDVSLFVLSAILVVLCLILYIFMRPYKRKG